MDELKRTFGALRAIMLPYSKGLDRVTDVDGHLYLNTKHIQQNKKPLFFGAVQLKKSGVTYHLMPLYTHPKLGASVSHALKKKMNGKSCFTFKASDESLFDEVAMLTKASYEEYKKAGYI